MKKKVVLGMSGGVDSSVAAAILKEQGYEVIGIFMKNWDDTDNKNQVCTATIDYNDAKKVAKQLDIKLYHVNFEEQYYNLVFEYFLDEYKLGRTPNPDIMCNKEIKFKAFLNYAIEKFNPEYIATGHYAKIEKLNNNIYLSRGKDENKDQSYFLAQINKDILPKLIFPLSDIEKSQVREIAKKYNLATANKKDSTGICFIGKNKFRTFLNNFIPYNEGDIVNLDNNQIVGKHVGLMYYTIGQRKGLSIGGAGLPYFVVGKNVDKNILFVTQNNIEKFLISDKLVANNINWLVDDISKYLDKDLSAKFRYRQEDIKVKLKLKSQNEIIVEYAQGFEAVTPGQQVVIYNKELCLGGATINQIYQEDKLMNWLI